MANQLAMLINGLVVVFTIDFARRLSAASPWENLLAPIAGALGVALAAAAASAFVPAIAAFREAVFAVQPIHILATIAGLVGAGLTAAGRRLFAAPDLKPIILLYGWRAVFGSLLLAVGLSGGLPPAFFWSAAAGDILVGVWALAIAVRSARVSRAELVAWNVVGLLDLLHVLALGAANLPAFYAAHPEQTRLTLLPLFGVPAFIALHLLLFPVFARRSSPSAT